MSSPYELPLPLSVPVRPVLALCDDRLVDGSHGARAVPNEIEAFLLAGAVQIVEEDASDAATDAAVLYAEILVTPLLEPGGEAMIYFADVLDSAKLKQVLGSPSVVSFIVPVAYFLEESMEVTSVMVMVEVQHE